VVVRAWSFGVVALVAVAFVAAGEGEARVSSAAKTFVYRGRTQIGYVQRVPADGPGVWSGLTLSQSVALRSGRLFAYCNIDGVVRREGVALRQSAKQWKLRRLQPEAEASGLVVHVRAERWSITDASRKRVASARGPDGPAAAVAFVSAC
jgi:hypothetical protein